MTPHYAPCLDAPVLGQHGKARVALHSHALHHTITHLPVAPLTLLQEDTPVADCNVLCLLHLPDQQCIMSGCEGGSIKLNYLEGHAASSATGDAVQLPTVLTGHEGKVTGLAALPGGLVLSCSEDRSLRVWDLRTMKQLHVSVAAV
jgi:WD40 repeat protein